MPEPGTKKPRGRPKGKRKKGNFKVAFTNKKAAKILSESGHNELSREDLSVLSPEEKLLLRSWGLPPPVLAKYREKGLISLFPWQFDCLSNEKVLEGSNLLYSAPTSAGKTLVAEILMIKRVLELGKKAIMILPFVSVAREKMYSLQELFGDAGVRVEGFIGGYNPPGGFKSVDIAICTIEKANSLINRLLEEGSLSQLGTLVVDEVHLLGDLNRGYLLELLLTKIKYMTMQSANSVNNTNEGTEHEEKSRKLNIQIVGMSATLPNLNVLASWLNAELVTTDFRPVPLVERIKINDNIYDERMQLVRPVLQDSLRIFIPNDSDHVVYLSLETVLGGHSILIFCPSKKMCEQTAEQIAREFYCIGNPNSSIYSEISEKLRDQLNGSKIADVIAQLRQCPVGLDETLEKSVAFGVAFHHAGLTFDERDILESSFKNGVLRVMVATSTLSAGVNLPARRVLIRSPNFNGGLLDVRTYRQMSGRAGRKGVDSAGESLLICSSATQAAGIKLIQSNLPSVKSALLGHQGYLTSSMKRALLEVIVSGVACTPNHVHDYAKSTLQSFMIDEGLMSSDDDIEIQEDEGNIIEKCLTFLKENEFIRLQKYESVGRSDKFMATQLGSACLASSLSPDEGITVFKELEKARRCFVLENELHVVYQVTPIYMADQWRNIDWNNYLSIWKTLKSDEKTVAKLVGVEESFIMRAMIGTISWRNPKQAAQLAVHQRFYTALALNDLVNEMPVGHVGVKYCMEKGAVQNLQQSASTFAGMVTAFSRSLGWFNLELLLSQFQERLQFGVQRELCDLVRLSVLNGQRARILYNAGLKTIAELAASEPAQVEHFLHKAGSFISAVHGGPESKPMKVVGKHEGMTEGEAAREIVLEARQFLQVRTNGSELICLTNNAETFNWKTDFII